MARRPRRGDLDVHDRGSAAVPRRLPPPPTGTPVTIWSATATPAAFATSDASAVELGVKFRSDVAGTVTGVRFYKGTTSTGTHTGTLWSASGTRLATATFTGETKSGWQQVTFSTPVSISPNTVYVVSYHTNVGNYAYTAAYFTSKSADNGPLHAPASGTVGGNGVYRYSSSSVFPNSTFNGNNYWVDVVFVRPLNVDLIQVAIWPIIMSHMAKRTRGIERFRQYLDRGTPGPNSYVVLLGLESLDTAGVMRVAERGIPYGAFERFGKTRRWPSRRRWRSSTFPAAR